MIGAAIPYIQDTSSGRRTTSCVVGTLFAINPALGAVGYLALGEGIIPTTLTGVLAVAAAGTPDQLGR